MNAAENQAARDGRGPAFADREREPTEGRAGNLQRDRQPRDWLEEPIGT